MLRWSSSRPPRPRASRACARPRAPSPCSSADASRTLRAVGAQAQHHGRIHRIGDAVFAEQPRTRRAESRAAIVPQVLRCVRSPPMRSGFGAVLRPVARAFMGHCERRIENPACISAHTARATARASRACGPAAPASSQAYSQMASESQTLQRSVLQHGNAPRRAQPRDVAREIRRVERQHALVEASPRCFSRIHGRSDHEE